MNTVKFCQRFVFEAVDDLLQKLTETIQQNSHKPIGDLQIKSLGFMPAPNGFQVQIAGGNLFAALRFDERKVPSESVRAYTNQRVDELRSSGQIVPSSLRNHIAAEIKQEMTLNHPPTVYTASLIAIPSINQIWLLAPSKAIAKDIGKLLSAMLAPALGALTNFSESIGDTGMNNLFLLNSANDISVGNRTVVTLDGKRQTLNGPEPLSYPERMRLINRDCNLQEISIDYGDWLSLHYGADGLLSNIVAGEKLIEEWQAFADPEDPDRVSVVGKQLWLEKVLECLAKVVVHSGSNTEQICQAEI